MMDRLPYLASTGLGMVIAWPIVAAGFRPIEVAAMGVLGFCLIMGFWGSYYAGRAAERKLNGAAHG